MRFLPLIAPLFLLADPAHPLDGPPRAITIQLHQPRALGERVLALFEGSRASSPAAALAAYRRARGGSSGLSKGVEALIAAMNPGMVGELAILDDAVIHLGRDRDGRPAWDVEILHDDGTLGALATALVLTDGATEPPLDGRAVDRLGRPGAPLMTRDRETVVLASDREALREGVARRRAVPPGPRSDLLVRIEPVALAGRGQSLGARRVGEALLGLGAVEAEARLGIRSGFPLESLRLSLHARSSAPPPLGARRIDAAWLEAMPLDACAAFAVAIDPGRASRDAVFALIDRVEKADPARASIAPIRLRLALMARAARIDVEKDLWSHLVGVSGFATADAQGAPDAAALVLHLDHEAAAERVRTEVVPRLAAALKLPRVEPRGVADSSGFLVEGNPIQVRREGSAVSFSWGSARRFLGPVGQARGLDSVLLTPLGKGSAGMPDRALLDRSRLPGRFAGVWPDRLDPTELRQVRPAFWVGETSREGSTDTIEVPDLRPIVRAVLDRLPLDPPPDAPSPIPPGGRR